AHVPGGQVHHVDVVPHAGAVRSRVVRAEDAHLVEPANRDLQHVRGQVVGNLRRVFADSPARVRADRVEVAQGGDLEGGVGNAQILQDLLDHVLRLAVGIGYADAHLAGLA